MLILSVDTSGKNGSLALVRFNDGVQNTLDVLPLEGGTFSAQLIPQIARLLNTHALSKKDIDAFAVVSGPGSFTGLRVGLAGVKALAEILHKPIAAVSLLEAVAGAGQLNQHRVTATLDAGRGDMFVGRFEIEIERTKCIAEELKSQTEFIAEADGQYIVTPDPKLANAFSRANLHAILVSPPGADAIARFGFAKIQAGDTVAPETLDASYLRRSDAEFKPSK